ncbi:threonine synthase [Patescibacteria group bacterium]|nr:threonine synthase [Patescibacteria group bacterium]
MTFYSINNKKIIVSFKQAVLQGLAQDGGLFMPLTIPQLSLDFFKKINVLSFQDIAYEVSQLFMSDDIPEKVLQDIITEAFNFDLPLINLEKQIYGLELFHGPTLAFKDFAARFMARSMSYFIRNQKKELTILVATSGDTGSAVAHGFFGLEGVKVIILYPSQKVSLIQEKQLTTMGGNITALEIKGTFDDCQKLVKQAFVDQEINKYLSLTSANSINIARLIPQSFYYFFAYGQLKNKEKSVIFSVPSGNFGNLTAGLLAKKMGLPVGKFLAATNINDSVPQYLKTGYFKPRPSKKTISNAMDVGNPSNFARILELYDHQVQKIRKDINGISFTDQQTKLAITEVYQKYDYILDPHSAVGYLGLKKYLQQNPNETRPGIFLQTAHPAKFLDLVQPLINKKVEIPQRLQKYLTKSKESIVLANKFADFKAFLLS